MVKRVIMKGVYFREEDAEIIQLAEAKAREEGLSFSRFIVKALKAYLSARETENNPKVEIQEVSAATSEKPRWETCEYAYRVRDDEVYCLITTTWRSKSACERCNSYRRKR